VPTAEEERATHLELGRAGLSTGVAEIRGQVIPLLCPVLPLVPRLQALSFQPTEDFHMESMDNFRERFEALEQQTAQLKQHTQALEAHTRTVERQLRWWRGIAYGFLMLGLSSVALSAGKTVDAQQGGLPARVAALEDKLVAVTVDSASNELVITGANLRIVNGLGNTRTTNGLGNLIVGYNESRRPEDGPDNRTGSHNMVVGERNNFSSFGGLVVGLLNEISGGFASVSAGERNTASGELSSVCGGQVNIASGFVSSVSGGAQNTASGQNASVSGGNANTASAFYSSVSGGLQNTASGQASSVSGGNNRSAPGQFNWAAGPLFADF
jgi:hypothetical protein